MKRCTGSGALALALMLASRAAPGDEAMTDANIVTALDISDSITPEQMTLELAGMAAAIQDQRVLAAIRMGVHRRIGFAVFAWHHDQFPIVVDWTVIATEADAQAVAQAFKARTFVDVEIESRKVEWYIGRLTDLSQAIDHANDLLMLAPYRSPRTVVNIVGNGDDNVGEDADIARDRAVARGITLNGVVLGSDDAMIAYYRQQVSGGPASFVMSAAAAPSLADAFVRKFIGDIVALADAQPPPISGAR